MELNNRMTKLINFNARQFNSNEANAKISKLVSKLIPKYFHTERKMRFKLTFHFLYDRQRKS